MEINENQSINIKNKRCCHIKKILKIFYHFFYFILGVLFLTLSYVSSTDWINELDDYKYLI